MTGKEALRQALQQPAGAADLRHAENVLQLLAELIDVWYLLDGDTDTEKLLALSEEEMQRELSGSAKVL
jgi:predicted Zn-dependent peptidase